MTTQTPPTTGGRDDLRTMAIEQLRKKRGLQGHIITYVSVNLLLVSIWYFTGQHFFWPVFFLFGWGIGLAFNIWDVYMPERMTEERIEQEMQRLSRGR